MSEHCVTISSWLDDLYLKVSVSFYFHQCELSFVFRLGQNQNSPESLNIHLPHEFVE